jgi:hypothetical protein
VTIAPGVEIGGYAVEALAGRGSHASVYRARHVESGTVVALKALGEELEPEGGWATMTRGARSGTPLAFAIDHPDVVATLAAFEHDGAMFLVQEWADGGTLEDELLRPEPPPGSPASAQRAARVGQVLARALAAVHAQGRVHRDVKPSNVLIVGGRYKLGDFGVAGLVQPTTGLTTTGVIAGTPRYMAPEQFTGFGVGPAADVFGLGLVLLQALHGHVPGEEAASFAQLAVERTSRPVPVPDSPLAALVVRCVERDPSERPPATVVQYALEAWLISGVLPDLDGVPTGTNWGSGPVTTGPPVSWGGVYPAGGSSPAGAAASGGSAPAGAASRGSRQGVAAPGGVHSPGGAHAPGGPSPGVAAPGMAIPGVARPGVAPGWRAVALAASGALVGVALVAAVGVVPAVRVLVAVALVVGGIGAGLGVRRRLARQEPEIGRRAAGVVFGAGERDDLSLSLMVEVEDVMRSLERVDDRVLGLTLVGMVAEYRDAGESSERQAALVNVVTIMEKVQARLSPWPVRHRDAIAVAVAVVGCITGIATLVTGWLA